MKCPKCPAQVDRPGLCPNCEEPNEWQAAEHALYAPPYREQLPGVGLGPLYGPMTAGAHQRQLDEYSNEKRGAIGSPALWDREQAAIQSWRIRQQDTPRKDDDMFEARLPIIAQSMPARELEAAHLFWRQRASVGRIAKAMGVASNTVRSWLERTRKRLRKEHT